MAKNQRTNWQKLKMHFYKGGLLYAFWRGIKYFIFLIKWHKFQKLKALNTISKGGIKIIYTGRGIEIYSNELELIQGAGLNFAINTLGLWTNSSLADWQILQKGKDYFDLKLVFRDLPLSQIWKINIENEQEITWQIEMEVEELLHIDETKITCLVSPAYRTWVTSYGQGDFPPASSDWHHVPLDNTGGSLVGVKPPEERKDLPPLVLEIQKPPPESIYPIIYPEIQEAPLAINTHLISLKKIDFADKQDYQPGYYNLLSAKISVLSNEDALSEKLSGLPPELSRTVVRNRASRRKAKQKISVLLVNLPWQRDGRWGVRAGSRWPHIKDQSEGNYLPFPFFLAYTSSLLRKYNIEVRIIDAIAEEISEHSFLEKILAMNFDYLVAETSIPSFYNDLGILKKIHKAGISTILCGPNSEIYKPQFLNEHLFIDFVLYGEYEFSLLELVKTLQENGDLSQVRGLIYCMGNEVRKNPPRPLFDINLLPWPNREELPMEKYWDLPGNIPLPSVQMVASRGCPFGCNFCLWPQVMYAGNHYRTREIKDVVDEMEYLVRERGFKSVYFDDDTFNIGKERMLRFSQAVKERHLQDIPWAIMARPDLMDEEILAEMKSAGLWAVKYGVESVSEKLLENCQKSMDFQKTDRMIKMAKNLDIKIHLTFAFGISGETKDSIQRTIDYALSLAPDSVQFSILTPFPGTQLFQELNKQQRILIKDWSKYDGHYHCVFQPDNLSPEDLEQAKRQAYLRWGEYCRKKRGFRGDIGRFKGYLRQYGCRYTLLKTLDYLGFIWVKRKRYLNGKT